MSVVVSMNDYEKLKIAFLHEHGDWEVTTSPMDEYGVYRKTYVCEDGQIWYEVNGPVWETARAEVEVKGIPVTIEQEVKLFRTEAWSSKMAQSVFAYEKF